MMNIKFINKRLVVTDVLSLDPTNVMDLVK